MSQSVLSLLEQGGISLIPLGICSVLVVAVVCERIWSFMRLGKIPRELIRRVEGLLSRGDWQEATRLLDESETPYARIAKSSLLRKGASQQEISDILTLAADAEIANAARPLPVLGTIGNIAPFIGLFGTVLGIVKAFQQIADTSNLNNIAAVQGSIAEALIATGAGLAVGIVAVIANNWCSAWVERYRLDIERFATEWSYLLDSLRPRESADSKMPETVA